MEDITDADYIHAKTVCKNFEKKLGEYHGLHLKSDTFLFGDVFGNFTKICSKIYHFDPAKFLSATASAWQAALINT